MINNVRDKLGPNESPAGGADEAMSKTAQLFKYLMDLSEGLPPNKDHEFRASDQRLQLANLSARLSKRPTMRERVEQVRAAHPERAPAPSKQPVTHRRIGEAFGFIAQLSAAHPDPSIGNKLAEKSARLAEKLAQLR